MQIPLSLRMPDMTGSMPITQIAKRNEDNRIDRPDIDRIDRIEIHRRKEYGKDRAQEGRKENIYNSRNM